MVGRFSYGAWIALFAALFVFNMYSHEYVWAAFDAVILGVDLAILTVEEDW